MGEGQGALGFAGLPGHLLEHIYALIDAGYGHHAARLGLLDRLRGLQVCKPWRQALLAARFTTWRLGGRCSEGELLSLARMQPEVGRLVLDSLEGEEDVAGVVQLALQSLQRQGLTHLEVCSSCCIPGCSFGSLLPFPTAFPRLASLHLQLSGPADEEWVSVLPLLESLKQLTLVQKRQWGQGGEGASTLYSVPGVASLTRLELWQFGEVMVDLSALPSLQQLQANAYRIHLVGGASVPAHGAADAGSADASNPAVSAASEDGSLGARGCALRRLELDLLERGNEPFQRRGHASLALPALPHLEHLSLERAEGLDGGSAALRAATALTVLRLIDCHGDVCQRVLLEDLPRDLPLALEYEPACESVGGMPIHELLPSPHTSFPNLRALQLSYFTEAGAWLGSVLSLLRLESLTVSGAVPAFGSLQAAAASLTHLSLMVRQGSADVVIDPSLFPALRRLSVSAQEGRVALVRSPGHQCRRADEDAGVGTRAAASPFGITHLAICAHTAALDFKLLPALEALQLTLRSPFKVTRAFAACTSLRQLVLPHKQCGGFTARLLRAAPTSLQALRLLVQDPAQLQPLHSMGSLKVLELDVASSRRGNTPPDMVVALQGLLHSGWPGWGQLQALSMPLPLPEGLRGAPRLRLLRLHDCVSPEAFFERPQGVLAALPALQELPALQQLQFRCRCGLGNAEAAQLHAALPHIHPVTTVELPPPAGTLGKELDSCFTEFLEAAQAQPPGLVPPKLLE